MANNEDKKIKKIATSLKELISFSESDLSSLVDRIEGGNEDVRRDVQRLFESLDANPSSKLYLYIIAGQVIDEYERLGQTRDADALFEWIISINTKNESAENREIILKQIEAFEEVRKKRR